MPPPPPAPDARPFSRPAPARRRQPRPEGAPRLVPRRGAREALQTALRPAVHQSPSRRRQGRRHPRRRAPPAPAAPAPPPARGLREVNPAAPQERSVRLSPEPGSPPPFPPAAAPPGSLGAASLNGVVERALALLPDLELPGSSRPAHERERERERAPAPWFGRGGGASASAGGSRRRLWVVWQTGEADYERVKSLCSHPRLVRGWRGEWGSLSHRLKQEIPLPSAGCNGTVRCHSSEASVDRSSAPRPAVRAQAVTPFLTQVDELYLSSDLVISRAGAITCSELMATGAPAMHWWGTPGHVASAPSLPRGRARERVVTTLCSLYPRASRVQAARRSCCRRPRWRRTTRASTRRPWRPEGRPRRSRTASTRRRYSRRRSTASCATRTRSSRCGGRCARLFTQWPSLSICFDRRSWRFRMRATLRR